MESKLPIKSINSWFREYADYHEWLLLFGGRALPVSAVVLIKREP